MQEMKLSQWNALDRMEEDVFLDAIRQINISYKAFVPSSINHNWDFNEREVNDILTVSEEAMQAITRLDDRIYSITDAGILNQEAIIRMIANKESNESSVIEGTQTMIEDAFVDLKLLPPEKRENAEELQNYIKALDYGIDLLKTLPLCERLIKDIHKQLMSGVRGEKKQPGQFKDKQNYIVQSKTDDISKAIFVPPQAKHTAKLMHDLFSLANQEQYRPSQKLVIIALLHYQFETIHPFNDGNGRIGRMIIILYLMQHKIINSKGIYLSAYFQKHRDRYYTYLTDIRESAKQPSTTHTIAIKKWISFFLQGLKETANDGLKVINSSIGLKRKYLEIITKNAKDQREENTMKAILDAMFEKPFFTAKELCDLSKSSMPSVNKTLERFVSLDVIKETTGYKRNRNYTLWEFVELFR
jgi:Fic family protein